MKYYLLFLLIFNEAALADISCVASMEKFFIKRFPKQERKYCSGLCQSNIFEFVKDIKRNKNKDISDIKILFIKPSKEAEDQAFHVRYGRDGFNENFENEEFVVFDYHVVANYKNQIYDFDFGPTPTIESKKDYTDNFMNQLDIDEWEGSVIGDIEELEVFEIPANEYLLLGKDKEYGINNQITIDSIPQLYSPHKLKEYLSGETVR